MTIPQTVMVGSVVAIGVVNTGIPLVFAVRAFVSDSVKNLVGGKK